MESTPMAKNVLSYKFKGKNNCLYSVEIKKNQSKIDILVKDAASIPCLTYSISLSLEELQKYNKYYIQFENIDEVFKDFTDINNINKLTSIELDKDLLKFRLTLPNIPNSISNKCLELMIKKEEMTDNDILFSLCEKMKEIDVLKRKNDYLFYVLGKTEKDFENYERAKELNSKITGNIQNSEVIKYDNLIVVQEGILKKLNKKIKEMKLLYRASKDGDNLKTFHSKCDGISNTVTFVKAKNGRKFGGFTEKGWNSNGKWYIDNNTFLFSLDMNECYYYKGGKGGNCMYGDSSYGPYWGCGIDLYLYSNCLSNNNSCSKQSNNFEYNGKVNCLSGGKKFQPEDYETYELILE